MEEIIISVVDRDLILIEQTICYRSKESFFHTVYETSAMFSHLVLSTNVFQLKEGLASLYCYISD